MFIKKKSKTAGLATAYRKIATNKWSCSHSFML